MGRISLSNEISAAVLSPRTRVHLPALRLACLDRLDRDERGSHQGTREPENFWRIIPVAKESRHPGSISAVRNSVAGCLCRVPKRWSLIRHAAAHAGWTGPV